MTDGYTIYFNTDTPERLQLRDDERDRDMRRLEAKQECADPLLTECKRLLALPPKCAKCGRVFTSPAEYRLRGKDGKPICRKLCRETAHGA